ncbi:MAG: FkbM family methyltransferase [Planctomycetota bacterium]
MTALLARLVPTGMALPILRGPLAGARWICGAAAGDGKGLSAVLHRLEAEQLEVAAAFTKPDSVCLDIGANVGLYTLLFARRGRHVYAFEPLPRNVRFLTKLVAINRLANVTVLPAAVMSRTCLTSFATGDNNALGKVDPDGAQPVVAVSCDEFVTELGVAPSVLKIDVEGAELAVFDGARRTFAEHRPALLLSVHGAYLRGQSLVTLERLGYRHILPMNGNDVGTATEYALVMIDPPAAAATAARAAWQPLTAELAASLVVPPAGAAAAASPTSS